MQIAATHFLPLTLVRRSRLLPAAGKVLVHPGQKVSTSDIIAETRQMGQHTLIDVRRALGLARADEADKLIERKPGDRIQKDDIIAQSGGLFPRALRSPVDGQIISIIAGRVLIESTGSLLQLQAGFAGTVTDVTPDYGATIETSAALAQGIWGNDRFDQGLLLVVSRAGDEELTKERMDVSMRGAVVVGGHCNQADVLRMGAEMPLRGLILSSISADLLPVAASQPYPIVIIEGIGRIPYNSAVFKILTTNDRRDTCLKASAYQPYTGERPEVIIPLPPNADLPSVLTEYKAGKTVRILGAPYDSQVGTLVQVKPGLTRLPNGVGSACAEVRLENNSVIIVPLANMDVLD